MKNNSRFAGLLCCIAIAGSPFSAGAQSPMTAIDWLNQPVAVPIVRLSPKRATAAVGAASEPAVTKTAVIPEVETQSLDESSREAVGLLPGHVTGFPTWLWQESKIEDLTGLLKAIRIEKHPAMQALLYTLILAETEAPRQAGAGSALLLARLDKLFALGALEPAAALLERSGPDTPELFRRWFDISLLLGEEDRVCEAMLKSTQLSPDYSARIFCLARTGDIMTADLTLGTAHALGKLAPVEAELLARFLDPELAEGLDPMPRPERATPLEFRLFEAIGETLSTRRLERAFAMADLRNTSGWKAELEAAERLARTGAISENRLIGIFTSRLPAASGGIWDRVEALQRFDHAMEVGDPTGVMRAMPAFWQAAQAARLEVLVARLYGERLVRLPIWSEGTGLAWRIALLSPAYEKAAKVGAPQDNAERFLVALAQGDIGNTTPIDALQEAIAAGFDGSPPSENTRRLLKERKLGEVLLRMIHSYTSASAIDFEEITETLRVLRHVGLEDTARSAALQRILLDGSY